jgi:LytS/YehU family sensor histidine kinase
MFEQAGWHPVNGPVQLALPMLAALIMFVGWVLADAGDDRSRSRTTRVVYALLGAGALATVAVVGVWQLSGGGEIVAQMAAKKGKAPPALPLMLLTEYINMLLLGGIVFAVAEMMQRRSRTQHEFEAVQRRRGTLEHQVLQSRLAAMQAQVEPRFLFDTLVDIEALYERDPQRAAANLDRLIAYLRAALPRLRESGSTVEAEIDLVKAYLQVVTALHDGRPALTATLAEECRTSRFYPMLLLPLVQRAVRHPSGHLPATISIDVHREAGHTVVVLRIALAGGCADDPELGRVRERLAGLYGDAAKLDCVELAGEATELTMRIPASGAAATR